ncbi:putative ATP-dependent RNA helicase ucp12 [Tilletia horrida]|uniref:ATP-dependent RNA helicase ucp12 n=1 Tax=Tilletia horrida TaxID=155126 RepID=A0AAN6GDP7_9BASI|nr:putative ATP-dependent RNA helicase ucp12 [Tilletia horrida]
MAPRKSNKSVQATGSTSKKAAPLPDWVKNGGKPPPKETGPTTTTYTRRDGTVVTQTHLFPPNTKTPINLLHERIQKTQAQWNKPELRPHLLPGSKTEYTCSVILTKPNKADAAHPHRVEFKPPMRRLGGGGGGEGEGEGEGSGPGALDGLFFSVDTPEKAKHWGATYALFRLFSTQQFGRVLPTLAGNPGGGPREYWLQMEAWLKSPEAKKWLGNARNEMAGDYLVPDPFEALARREREAKERQIQEAARAAAIEKGVADLRISASAAGAGGSGGRGGGGGGGGGGGISKAWAEAKEVRMAPTLRELVERTIRNAMQVFGNRTAEIDDEVDDDDYDGDSVDKKKKGKDAPRGGLSYDAAALSKALSAQGFRAGYVKSAMAWLGHASELLAQGGTASATAARDPLIAALRTKTLTPLEAAMQYLILYVPEEDLPPRLRPSKASDGFVSAAYSGEGSGGANGAGASERDEELGWRWTEDALVKEAKWPRKAAGAAIAAVRAWKRSDGRGAAATAAGSKWDAPTRLAIVTDVLLARLGAGGSGDIVESAVQQVLGNAAAALALSEEERGEMRALRDDERMAVEAVLGEERIKKVADQPHAFEVALTGYPEAADALPAHAQKEDLRLRIYTHRLSCYPSATRPANLPTFTMMSSTLPSYLCLALTKQLVVALSTKPDFQEILEAGQGGTILSMIEELEGGPGWWAVLDEPSSLDSVMAGLVVVDAQAATQGPAVDAEEAAAGPAKPSAPKTVRMSKPLRRDDRIDKELLSQHEALLQRGDHKDMLLVRRSLPAFAARDRILSFLTGSAMSKDGGEFAGRVLIIAGETGCGKSTQTPQYLLEDAIARSEGSLCNIIVTQPRRVSAMGLAARVAAERGEKWDDAASESNSSVGTVGYAIRGERRASKNTRLLFTTTGVLLRRLSSGSDPDLRSISHVIVDEVHERSIDSDVLLLELRELLRRNRQIKVVLMSATIQQELFVDYFGGAPCLEIPGRTFAVQDHYIEDVLASLKGWKPSTQLLAAGKHAEAQQRKREQVKKEQEKTPGSKAQLRLRKEATSSSNRGSGASTPLGSEPGGDDASNWEVDADETSTGGGLSGNAQLALKGLQHSDRTDFDLLGAVVRYVVEKAEKDEAAMRGDGAKKGGAILVFCSGVGEIRQAIEAISRSVVSKVDVLPLHANLSPAEQRRVFNRPKPGHRKIVVSTNVAETSITIDDISYVVDTGRVKETKYNPETGLTSLVEGWASRAACKQRRGRAGRVREGECFKLYSRQTELDKQPKQSMPEMLRVPLENVFLQAKAMHEDVDLRSMLSKALSPPSMASMQSALENLMECGAMRTNNGFKSRLTALGRHLSNLPLDVKLGKLLVFGALFGVLGPMLSVAAIMSSKPLFVSPTRDNDAIAKARKSFAVGNSDLLTDAYAFNAWLKMRASRKSHAEVRDWCEANNMSQATLRDIFSLRFELLGNLQDLGFARRYEANSVLPLPSLGHPSADDLEQLQQADCNALNLNMLRAVLAAALWPSIVRIQTPAPLFKESAGGALLRDPEARTIKYFDRVQGRLFLFGTSVNFDATSYASSYMAVFQKAVIKQSAGGPGGGRGGGAGGASAAREKVMMRDANEVPLYALLLFGGKLKVNHMMGGITIGSAAPKAGQGQDGADDGDAPDADGAGEDADRGRDGWVKVRASGRIAVLCSQLRALLDAVLDTAVEDPGSISWDANSNSHQAQVLKSIVALLTRDGVTEL